MPFISSPVAYPPSSSPQTAPPRKRKRSLDRLRSPLRSKIPAASNAGFIEDSGSEDEQHHEPSQQKRSRYAGKENLAVSPANPQDESLDCHQGGFTKPVLGASIFERAVATPQSKAEATTTNPIMRTTGGKVRLMPTRQARPPDNYEQMVAARTKTATGKAQRGYYGIAINTLLEEAHAQIKIEQATRQPEAPAKTIQAQSGVKSRPTLMWTEKYRPRKFTDLVGDDRTHRTVMHWLKAWDSIVFPGASTRARKRQDPDAIPKEHRKVLLLTGPPGLGKTTLAHVCARQAGYEATEINASDERSKDVVKGRIRDMLGTENVKSASGPSKDIKKAAKPICVVVDEVDGVVSGSSGSGEGGFVKALIDLILLDQRNARNSQVGSEPATSRKRKGDNFRMLRPLIMICNDAYHPALRPLRASHLVEIIHCGRPQLNTVATRVQHIFEKEGIGADGDAIRKLCESCWGTTSKKEGGVGAGAGDGDIRSVLVMAEWIARRMRSQAQDATEAPRLTKKWMEQHLGEAAANGNVKGLGRGGTREIVDRVFMEGAGMSRPKITTSASSDSAALPFTSVKSVNEAIKAGSSNHLRTLIDGHGETDRIMTDLFSQYPSQPYQDDTFLTKPTKAYEWLEFHDRLSSAVYSSSEWELAPYLSTPAICFHHLFATSAATRARCLTDNTSTYSRALNDSSDDIHPFSTFQASFAAHEATKQNIALLQSLHEGLSLPLTRLYPRAETMAAEFAPYLLRMLSPSVTPVLITSSASGPGIKGDNKTTASVRKASEKALVDRAVQSLLATGLRFDRHRIEDAAATHPAGNNAGWTYRLAPALDDFGAYPTGGKAFGNDVAGGSAPGNRYGVRQVLVQECAKEERRRDGEARARRRTGGGDDEVQPEAEPKVPEPDRRKVPRDFFGRAVADGPTTARRREHGGGAERDDSGRRIWVGFHEGYSNAVRKPISIAELLRGL